MWGVIEAGRARYPGTMAEQDKPLSPDAPKPPGTPQPPNLDVDAEQFMTDEELRTRDRALEDAERDGAGEGQAPQEQPE